jgi:hypothetical protein
MDQELLAHLDKEITVETDLVKAVLLVVVVEEELAGLVITLPR